MIRCKFIERSKSGYYYCNLQLMTKKFYNIGPSSFSSFAFFASSGSKVFSPLPLPKIFSSKDFRESGLLNLSNDFRTMLALVTGLWMW